MGYRSCFHYPARMVQESAASGTTSRRSSARTIAMKLLHKKTIMGCEARGGGNSPYLTRITLIETRRFSIYLHWFHRSDADDLHDHPWDFTSMILWRGYAEETPE